MNTLLTQTGSKRVILQTGKAFCAQIAREISNGIELPPEPTTCCMSGCTNCVWVEYAETVAKLLDGNCEDARQIVLNKIKDPNLKMFLTIELRSIQYNLEQSKNNSQSDNDKIK